MFEQMTPATATADVKFFLCHLALVGWEITGHGWVCPCPNREARSVAVRLFPAGEIANGTLTVSGKDAEAFMRLYRTAAGEV
jgi:hypothetical protein